MKTHRSNVEIVNFGCRLNLVEGEAMRRAAQTAGRDNLVIVNTCAVTAEAARQARQTIRRLKREAPERTIIVTGCAAQTAPQSFAAMPEVAKVLGNAEKLSAEAFRPGRRSASPSAIFSPRPPRRRRRSAASRIIPAPFSPSRPAAIIAAPSASSPMAGGRRARRRRRRSSPRRKIASRKASRRSC